MQAKSLDNGSASGDFDRSGHHVHTQNLVFPWFKFQERYVRVHLTELAPRHETAAHKKDTLKCIYFICLYLPYYSDGPYSQFQQFYFCLYAGQYLYPGTSWF